MNSGLMTLERGSCSTYVGVLTKSDVLETAAMEPYSRSDAHRMVGGSFFDKIKSVFGKVAKVAKPLLGIVPHPAAQIAFKGLGALGYGTLHHVIDLINCILKTTESKFC